MIIGGEKVPAFSATTLSIPESPHDNLEAIIESSRELYSRPRADVEDEIRETIEASEKFKKELSDSGRQELENIEEKPKFVFKAADITSSKSYTWAQNKNRTLSPMADFKKLKVSPNTAEDKTDRPGLKDLGSLYAAKISEKIEKPEKSEPDKAGNNASPKSGANSDALKISHATSNASNISASSSVNTSTNTSAQDANTSANKPSKRHHNRHRR